MLRFQRGKTIKGYDSGELISNGLFNRLLKFSSLTNTDQPTIRKSSITRNLTEMFEGSTIYYAINKTI